VSAAHACRRVYCLTLGHEYSPRWISLEGGGDEILRLPITAVLALTAEGPWLLDTGLAAEHARRPERVAAIYAYGAPEVAQGDDPLLDAIAACGVDHEGLAGVAVSHLHIDHSGGLRHFEHGPPIVVQGRELEFATASAGEAEAYWREDYVGRALRWEELDGDGPIAPGVDAIATPGHSPGHMSYRVRTRGSGTLLFAVDAIDLQDNLDEDAPVGWSADGADEPLRRRSHDRLVALAAEEGARLIPGHCPRTWPALRRPPEHY
jgi:glyoxylase-like metal-dependent hydrolase (beta-lactamase superfamily II)